MGTLHHSGRPWNRLRRQVLAASDTCWLCGLPGARTVDLIIPLSRGGDPLDPTNLRPAHGWCNSSRGNRPPKPSRRSRRW